MAAKMSALLALFTIFAFAAHFGGVSSTPAIATGYDAMAICIENCALCKKMYGAWFEGPLCAESCIKFKGKMIPDCEDYATISSFINKL